MLQIVWSILLKTMILISGYFVISKYYDGAMKLTLSWLYGYLVMFIGMIILSFSNNLTEKNLNIYFIIYFLVFIMIFYLKKLYKIYVPEKKDFDIYNILSLLIFSCVLFLLFRHNIVYYDMTDDTLVQGMPKLAFIQQHRTLFVNYNTVTINTFANEWFGEINGLYYLIMTGQDTNVLIGNVEIFLFIFITVYEECKELHNKGKKEILFASYISTTPVVLGLAMTMKTDLASLIMLSLMIVIFWRYIEKQENFLLLVCIAVIGATASTKITLVPIAGLFSISLVIYYFKYVKNRNIYPIIIGILIACIFSARYVINIFIYNNPFKRALNEKVNISIGNIGDNIKGIIERFCETGKLIETIKPWSSNNWVITKGIGYGGEIIVIILITFWICYFLRGKINKRQLYLFVPYTMAFLYVLIGTVWYEWSFRYLYPYILPLELIALVKLDNYLEEKSGFFNKILKNIMCISLLFIMTLNSIRGFREGQAFPVSPQKALHMSKTERKLLYSSLVKYQDLEKVPGLLDILSNGGKGLILDEFSSPYYEFFGDNNCVHIDLVATEKELMENFNEEYDFIAIASLKYNSTIYKKFENEINKNNFSKYIGSFGAVFMKEGGY
ncbi:Uncharacterised protein [uncultured Clostridium sp.]|uniref:Glycosyltransferase RgtA/B/C/D-like domain-containing protein n=1 Tax=Muricoprocola aceti TaxID=2981772 RepID=A0ABT2SQG0_9FIRM|nr:hypothetical protein [Muricoprocola aceti]MCU6726495.1 hypothetical protein [Muricoprocola aceti]SCH92388.1 Uncharacterised protein [uncultured Clostridium sp.]